MAEKFFFFSYAQADRDEHLERFFEEVVSEVRKSLGARHEVVFRDVRNVTMGERWDDQVPQALARCAAMVCLYSPFYVGSEACGKEYSAFRRRIEDYRRAQGLAAWPGLLLPVPWRALLPQKRHLADRTIIHALQGLPPDATRRGVLWLIRDQDPRAYRTVVDNLVTAIGEAFNDHTLPDAAPPAWDALPNAFAEGATPPTDRAVSSKGGPDRVHFVYVAPCAADSSEPRYGEEAADWRPFQPPDETKVEPLALQVAAGENFRFPPPAPADQVLETIEHAEKSNSLVVVIVDPWATSLATYQRLLTALDQRASRHVAVVVPWNRSHAETVQARDTLRAALANLFANRLDPKDPRTFLDEIETPDAFRSELRKVLTFLRARTQKAAALARPMPGAFGPLPTISGPASGSK
jgi:FxsC-like protein